MNSIRINNFNYAGAPLVLGLLGGVSVAGIWATQAGLGNADGRSAFYLVMLAVFGVVTLYALVRACTSSVFWIEFGDRLVFRDLFRTCTTEWSDVKTIFFEEEQSRVGTKIPGISVSLGTHCILVILLKNGRELRIKVISDQEAPVRKLVGDRMPELKNRPFSEFR